MTALVLTVPGKPVLEVVIGGKPQPKERPRSTTNRKTGKRFFYTPQATRRYQSHVATLSLLARQAWQAHHGLAWPLDAFYEVHVNLTFRDKRIADGDNCLKAVLDGAEGVLWRNDRQVVSKHVWRTAPSKEAEGVSMRVRIVPEPSPVHVNPDPTEPFGVSQ